MRHLEQILKDKEENDAALAKANKRAGELQTELEQLYNAVRKHVRQDVSVYNYVSGETSSLAAQITAVENGHVIER